MGKISERDLEDILEDRLVNFGYEQGLSKEYNLNTLFFEEDLFRFLEHTQKDTLKEYKEANRDWKKSLIALISKNIDEKGLIEVLRKGVKDFSISDSFYLAFFKPNTEKNPEDLKRYRENIFKVVRQFCYSLENKNSIDTIIVLNGIPIIAIELKNKYTGQNVDDAMRQFKETRNSKDKIFGFNRRFLAYFAVDNDLIYMTTQLKDKDTFFLPFNKGVNNGTGNPIPEDETKGKTSYLWDEILQKDSLLDILKRFYFIQTEEVPEKKYLKHTPIFPRYHQLSVVRDIVNDLLKNGIGQNYLIQHSAGSGKTNSISWLAHRLSTLHNLQDNNIFDSIIVITDRKVLDKQLQDAIYQLDHAKGVVVKIDDNKDSSDLAKAIDSGVKIIITTIQKFPYALGKIENFDKRKFAVIIDEAHSSTHGETMGSVKVALAGKSLEEAAKEERELEKKQETERDVENVVEEQIKKRSKLSNVSFFAFTATPKNKTLQTFGRIGEDEKPHPFSLYSMKQAIEEKFILDVLKNYMTYELYFKVGKKVEDSSEFDKGKAAKEIMKYVSLHEHNIRQKCEIIVNDFEKNRKFWLDGNAKGMVVTASRLHAVKFKQEIDKIIKEKKFSLKSIVAFSGDIEVDEIKYNEKIMNGFESSKIPEQLNGKEYQLLIVAEKFQTGFDQPKLCAMYVDKQLSDVKAVQTLSRLNRTYKDKKTFVLDFVNSVEEIQNSFKPYFEATSIDEMTDPNLVFRLSSELYEYGVYRDEWLREFAKFYFKKKRTEADINKMDNLINHSVDNFEKLEDDEKENFKVLIKKYLSTYRFLLNIYPIKNTDLYFLQIYLSNLAKKLPSLVLNKVELDDLISLDFYKLQKMNDDYDNGDSNGGEDISITTGEGELKGLPNNSSLKSKEDLEDLDAIIERMNERFGTEFKAEHKVFFENLKNYYSNNESLTKVATANSKEDFKKTFEHSYFLHGLLHAKRDNDNLFSQIINNGNLKRGFIDWLSETLYNEINF